MSFSVGESVFLRVNPQKGVVRFGMKGKLSPRYIGPFKITKRVSEVSDELELPAQMTKVHKPDESHIIDWKGLEVQDGATYEEAPIRILDAK